MGSAPRRTREERQRQRQRQRQRRRRQQRETPTPTPTPTPVSLPAKTWSDFSYGGWNLLPLEKFTHKGLYYSMSFDHDSFARRYAHFMNFSMWIGTPHKEQELSQQVLDIREEAKEKFFLNQRLRFQFKRLISAFLIKKLPLKNEVDPITMESPNQAVFLYDHANRCKFQFEAKELLRDFSTRLLTHEDLFPTPLFLRNPFTNSKLHMGQILSIYSQIRSFGQMHWTLECYQDAKFQMALFSRDNQRKLRLSALRNLMQSPDGSYFVLDFIEAQHDILNQPFDIRTYTWALRTNKCHSMERIRSWKSMCYAFYEIEITEEDIFERQKKIAKLAPLVLKLCSPCVEIQLVRRTYSAPKP